MSTLDDVQRQVADAQHEIDALRSESIANMGLLASAIRRARSDIAMIDQAESVRRIAGPTSLLDWTPRSGSPARGTPASSLADRLAGGAGQGAGTPAALQSEFALREVLDTFDEVFLSSIGEARLELGLGTTAKDWRLRRTGIKKVEIDDGAGAVALLHLRGDLVQVADAALAVVYNGDGSVSTVTRSGAQGAATTTVAWSLGKVTSVITVRGGKTVTITPTYSGAQITSVVRAVA